MKSKVYKRKVGTADEMSFRTSDAAVAKSNAKINSRRTTRDLRTRVAKCTEDGGGVFESLLRTVTDLSF